MKPNYVHKEDYKVILLQASHLRNEENLRLMAQGKCARILTETYGKKEYIQKKNIHNVRQQFRARYGLQPFAESNRVQQSPRISGTLVFFQL